MSDTKPENVESIKCSKCLLEKSVSEFYKRGKMCCRCNNEKRRDKYKTNEEHRKKLIKMATDFKHNKVLEKQKIRQEEQDIIGIENKKCKYCNKIKHSDRFRHNRLKCRDCERDEPTEKFKRYIRTRIYNCLRNKNKTKHTLINVGSGTEKTITDYTKFLLKKLNYSAKIIYDRSKPDGTPRKLMDISKLHQLGWKHSIDLHDGIEQTYRWFLENADKVKEVKM
jgi:hypothetical protein